MTARAIFLDSLGDAVLAVRSIIKEPTAIIWTDTQLENLIKEGCVDICAKTLCYETITDVALYDNIIEYLQPSNCIKVRGCTFYDSIAVTYRGLQKIHPKQISHLGHTAGDPYFWYHFGGRIGILPVPDNVEAAGADKVYVYHSATTETITNLPGKYREFAVNYAAAMALLKRRKNQAAISLYTVYLSNVKFARMDLARMEIDSEDMFRTPDRTIGGA